MANVVDTNASVSISFGEEAGASLVIFEGNTGLCNVFEYVCYRVYPKEVSDIRASAGEMLYTRNVGVETKEEFLTFNNSDRGSLRYPAANITAMVLSVYFDTDGNPHDHDDGGVSGSGGSGVGLTFDQKSNTVKASAPFFGLVHVTYTTTYRVWNYAPQYEEFGIQDGYRATYGMLAAIYNGSITTFSTASSDWGNAGAETYEVYRVVSDSLVNSDGAWELPPNWPDETWSDTGAPTSVSAFAKYERVHEVGFLEAGSRVLQITQYNVRNEQPKASSAQWKPKWKMIIDNGQGTIDTVFENSYATLDMDAIKADVKNRYPGIEVPDS